MAEISQLSERLQKEFQGNLKCVIDHDELTVEVAPIKLLALCRHLKETSGLQFDQLMDLCGVDYSEYGKAEWATTEATGKGFGRGVEQGDEKKAVHAWTQPRFAVVYHLLSLKRNHRLRVRTFLESDPPVVPSVNDIWSSANWYEREAFDLYGILFDGHADLRRILTDYGFVGHPFRKDFPLIGEVEMRYDAAMGRVIYEPVSIEPRVLVPKIIRDDSRYIAHSAEGKPDGRN